MQYRPRIPAFIHNSFARLIILYKTLGHNFFIYLIIIEHLTQAFIFGGGSSGFVGTPILFLFRSFGTLTASRMQVLKTIAISPWALKPFYGILSDCVYIGGFNKNPYIIITTLSAIVSCILIVFVWPVSPVVAVILFFFIFLQIALSDLLIETRYIAKTSKKPNVSPDLVSFTDIISGIAQLCSVIIVGLLIKYIPLNYIYLVPLPVFFITLYLTDQNWLGDEDYSERRPINRLQNIFCHSRCLWFNNDDNQYAPRMKFPIIGYDREKLRQNWRIFTMALIIGSISLIINCIGLFNVNTTVLFIISVIAAPVIIACFFFLIDHKIAKIQTFSILRNMFAISIESATFFFFTDNKEQYPEGPHFSAFFYVTIMGIIAIIFAFISTLCYNFFMTDWNYRRILLISNLLYVLTSSINIIFFFRVNLIIGIPDKIFILGGEILQVVTGQLSELPLKVAMLQLCPRDTAATMYALLAGSSNLGYALAQYQGAFVLDILDIKPTGASNESEQFKNMGYAAVIATVLPIIPIFFIYLLIPDKRQTECLLDEEERGVDGGGGGGGQIYHGDGTFEYTDDDNNDSFDIPSIKKGSTKKYIINDKDYDMIEFEIIK